MNTSTTNSSSSILDALRAQQEILPYISLSVLIGAVSILSSGFITRLKSDLSKVDASCRDLESTVRYILLPCACVVYFATVHPKYLYDGFLLDKENITPLFLLTLVEPLGSALMQKFYLNTQKEEEVSGFTLFLTRLRLCSQSLAFPLGTTLGLELMYDKDEFNNKFGIDFDSTKMLIVFVYTLRGAFQRIGCRYVSKKLHDNDDDDGVANDGDDNQKKELSRFATVNSYFGDQLPALCAIILGFIFNGFMNDWSKTEKNPNPEAGGIVGFVVGVCETLSGGFIPYCCVMEGFQLVASVWTIKHEEEENENAANNQQEGEKKNNKIKTHKIDSMSELTIPVALFALRLMAAYLLSIFTAKDAGRDAVLTIVLCSLSGAVPFPYELSLIFDSEKDRFVLRRICLRNFVLSCVLLPMVAYWLVM